MTNSTNTQGRIDAEFFAENQEDPYPTYTVLRGECPVYDDPFSKAVGVSRYDDVTAIFRAPGEFSARAHRLGALVAAARKGIPPEELGPPRRTAIVHDDDPYHAFLRGLIARSFTPKAIGAMRPMVERIMDDLLTSVPAGQVIDLVPLVSVPLPSRVIATMYGVPDSEYHLFKEWTEKFLSPDPDIHLPAIAKFNEYFLRFMQDRRREPRDDMITHLVDARDANGDPLPDEEILAVLMQNILAGNETTTNLVTNMLGLLADRPQLWAQLREDRTLIAGTIEETLRFESPVQWMPRTTRADVEIAGCPVAKGRTILPMMGAANRDPEAFEKPDEFNPGLRRDNRHLAFGLGVHFCAGAPLARLEASVVLEKLLDRFATVTRGGEPQLSTVFLGVRGRSSLPLLFEAA